MAPVPPSAPRPGGLPRAVLDPRLARQSAADEIASLPLLVPAPAACELLGLSRRTLARLIAKGEIRVVKLGDAQQARVLIPRDELRRLAGVR